MIFHSIVVENINHTVPRTSDLLHVGLGVLPVLLFPSLLLDKLEQFLAVEGTGRRLVHLVAAPVSRGDV